MSKAFLLWWIQVVTVSFAAILIFTYGWFDELWNADQTKISFIIIIIFFSTSIATGFLSFRSDTQYIKLSNYIWFASETMVTLGLIGTVAGFLLMLSSAFDNLDVSNVENMKAMFNYTNAFNGDIGRWNVSSVSRDGMAQMLQAAKAFNKDLSL